ncbi:uncharacterized protein G2W53_016233 [Senna tora]|uniref:Uncharacterized protein n=1 Tax=Senna tora TaxID=362788 RepID=A0A834TP49_9FABA|nr:uncharacterized protein G2W53_016233 [Senna tora]
MSVYLLALRGSNEWHRHFLHLFEELRRHTIRHEAAVAYVDDVDLSDDAVGLGLKSFHCHIALAPIPWMRSIVGLDCLCVLGTQQCMMVLSPRSVVVDFRPALEKE